MYLYVHIASICGATIGNLHFKLSTLYVWSYMMRAYIHTYSYTYI